MKKLWIGIAFLGAMAFSGFPVSAQEEEEPCPGRTTNQWEGFVANL